MTLKPNSGHASSFDPRIILPALSAGLANGTVCIIAVISFAAMIFSGSFSIYLSRGIGFLMFGLVLLSLFTALTSKLPNMVALPQDGPVAIIAATSALIASALVTTQPEQAVPTLIAAIMIGSVLTGVAMFTLGRFRLGNIVGFIPYPIIGGFLAGTGYFMAQGAFSVMVDENFSLDRLSYLLQSDVIIRWLPGVIFGTVLLLILRRWNHYLIIPSMLGGAAILFYLTLLVTGTPFEQAQQMKLLLGPFTEGGGLQLPDFGAFRLVDWSVIIGQIGNIATVALISIFAFLLNLSGLEVIARRDIDLNHELQVAGIANIAAGLGGSTPGFSSVSLSALGFKFGIQTRLIGVVVFAMGLLTMLLGTSLLNYFPRFVLGGLAFFIGLSFLAEWLYDSWFRLGKRDYLTIVVIMIVMITAGVLTGVAVGLLLAVGIFAADYSRINVVKHSFSGEYFRSNVERPRTQRQLLSQKGDWIYILELQGYIFFGTAYRLLEKVRQRFKEERLAQPRYIVLDFRHVSGIDISAVNSFIKMKQFASQGAILVFSNLSERIRRQLEKEMLTPADAELWKVFPDLDHALEWCEEQILKTFDEVGLTPRRKAISSQTDTMLPTVGGKKFFASLIGDDLSPHLQEPNIVEQLSACFERKTFDKGHVLMQQGQAIQGLYFVEKGQVQITQEIDGNVYRLRVLGDGAIIGEVGLYMGGIATASAVTAAPSTLHFASLEKIQKLEQDDPKAALILHKFLGTLLGERLTYANKAFEAALG